MRHWSQTLSRRCSHVGSRFTFSFSSSSSFCSSLQTSSPSSFLQSCLDSRGSRVPRAPTKNSKDSVDSRHAPSGAPIDRLFLLLDTDPSGFNWFRSVRPYEKPSSFKVPRFFPLCRASVWLLISQFDDRLFDISIICHLNNFYIFFRRCNDSWVL